MDEIWKDIDGYNGVYQVSNFGRIRSNGFKYVQRSSRGKLVEKYAQPKIMAQAYTVEGYLVVTLFKNGKPRQYKVHRLIAESFIPNPENKPVINHINGIKDDNRIENLEWCTVQENTQHAHDTGLCGINAKSKQVARLNEDGSIAEVFESALQAARAYGHYNSASNLHKICRNGRGRWCGFRWKYINFSEYIRFKGEN